MITNTRPGFWRDLWELIHPYWKSEEKLSAWSLLLGVIALTLGLVYMDVWFNKWNNAFFNSLQNKDRAAFFRLMLQFCGIAAIYIVVYIYSVYVNQWLQIRWRRWLTKRYLREWLGERIYYRMQLTGSSTDNPDQRIAEDLRLFVENTLELVLGGLNAVVSLIAFLFILWGLSGALEFTLAGQTYELYGYMVWIAAAYAIGGTYLVHRVGKRLIPLQFDQQRYEADFRYNLVRFRENAEGVALYRGEQGEMDGFLTRFEKVASNWWGIMTRMKLLNTFRYGYNQAAIVFPYLVTAPRYFAGKFTLGDLTQTAGAFSQVQTAMSWFINVYVTFAAWKATVDRLTGFHRSVLRAQIEQAEQPGVVIEPGKSEALVLDHVDLLVPGGRVLLSDATVEIQRGARVLVRGPSGTGKSTLFRAIAGIWPFGRGTVRLPSAFDALFLPQRPYFPLGTLKAAIAYPGLAGDFTEAQVSEALRVVGLPELCARLDEEANWSMQLSGGEQQRIAFARALLHKPKWLFLDEATSALDETAQTVLHNLIVERLADSTIVSIAHRPSMVEFHDEIIELAPDSHGKGRLRTLTHV
ncbi:MAG TPA: ABC transporter ATP-binding protein/permease [Burkholderiales bacterium]|nr:ABC transporter ATP-binding protein/permease [Burkholderiales bacterium]